MRKWFRMKIKLFSLLVLLVATVATSFGADAGRFWTYRDMYEARKACAEYYYTIYSKGRETNRTPTYITDADIKSFKTVADQASADMAEFESVLDTPYPATVYPISFNSTPVDPNRIAYRTGLAIPYFGPDFQFPIPGYSTISPYFITGLRQYLEPKETVISLFNLNGYGPSSQVTPDKVFIFGLPEARTVKDVEQAHWFTTVQDALVKGPRPGSPKFAPLNYHIWEARGTLNPDGTLKIGTWIIVTH